jgi:hypothetical protein
MFAPQAGGEEPYPEPTDLPSAPPETGPLQAPQEEPPAAPFDDGGRPTDAGSAPFDLTADGLHVVQSPAS